MRDGVHSIYFWYMDNTAFIHEWRSTRHIFMRHGGTHHLLMWYGVHCIYWWDIEYTVFNLERWSTQHLLMTDGVTVFTYERWRQQHLLLRDRVHSIYSSEMVSTAYSHQRCSQQNLRMRDGIHNIYSLEMVYTAFNLERWNTQHILMEDGIHSIPFSPGWGWLRNRSLIFVSPSSSSLRSPQHWLSKYGIHSIFSCEMEYTVYIWSTYYLLLKEGVHSIYTL